MSKQSYEVMKTKRRHQDRPQSAEDAFGELAAEVATSSWVPVTTLVKVKLTGSTKVLCSLTFSIAGWEVTAFNTPVDSVGTQAVLDQHGHKLLGSKLTLVEAMRLGEQYLHGLGSGEAAVDCGCQEIEAPVDWAAVDERVRQVSRRRTSAEPTAPTPGVGPRSEEEGARRRAEPWFVAGFVNGYLGLKPPSFMRVK